MKLAFLSLLLFAAPLLDAKQRNLDSASVKFEFVGNTSLMVVPVLINGRGPYKFLLDTGATHTILSSSLALQLGGQIGKTEQLVTAGGALAVTTRTVNAMQVGDVRIPHPQIAVADFALLNRLHLDGILGSDHLKSFNLFIDYSKRLIRMDHRP